MMVTVLGISAQYIPTHDKYVTWVTDGKSFLEYFPTWEPGTKLSEDENFFISRVKMQPRFVNRNTQARAYTDNDNQRKFTLDTPMGISETYWQCLPRYVFDGDNFSMWSYVDEQGGWSKSWIRSTGAYSDVCHKNGVLTSGGTIFFDSWGGDNTEPNNIVTMLCTKNTDGTFKYLEKFIKFLRYYGIDGVAFNPEGTISKATDFQDFLAAVHEKAPEYGWRFSTNWYGANSNSGSLNLTSNLGAANYKWFVKDSKIVNDIYFLNYDWNYYLTSSMTYAEKCLAGSSNNVYCGYDIQGNWMGRGQWTRIPDTKASICFWGNHNTDMIYQNSTEQGSSDEAVQKCYQEKLEQVFSGGNRNPANTPDIVNGITESGASAMKKFHGIAALMPARSTLQTLPFVTRFSLGNGKVFRLNGETTFENKWYGLSTQDYLPTWRWWISKEDGTVPEDGINCNFTFNDSWWAGSCLRFNGQTAQSIVRLFKTNFNVGADDNINLVYKLNGGMESNAKLFWSFVGNEAELHYADIPATDEVGKWNEFKTTAQVLGMTGNVAVMGIRFDNTSAAYEMLLGELGIVPNTTYNPVMPTITKAEILGRTYNSLSYKLIWDCGRGKSTADESIPTYNEDVDTWYFEVYSQTEGKDPILDGCTTSWAHYVVGAKPDAGVSNYRIGVRAVAPDGKTTSEIAWSDYMTVESTQVEGIEIDKPIVKTGEQFRVQYKDPNHSDALRWQIVNPSTGKDLISGEDAYDGQPGKETIPEKTKTVPTTSTASSPKWYNIIFMTTDAVATAQGDGELLKTVARANDDKQVWRFEGNMSTGFTAINKAGQTMYVNSTAQNGKFYASTTPGSNKTFKLVASTNTIYSGYWMIAPSTTSNYMNQWGDGSGDLGLWNDKTDANQPLAFIAPAGESSSEFTCPDPAGTKGIGVDLTINDPGNYDVYLTDKDGTKHYRGFVQISGGETGALPLINDFTADKTELTKDDATTNVTFDINRLGEGTVSQGLEIKDPYMFMLPKESLPKTLKTYAVGLWYKPTDFKPSKYGTNFINKRDISISWPNNNWGAFWVHIWPETYYNDVKVMEDNAISYTMFENEATKSFCGNSNKHEIPNLNCYTGDYGLSVGTWSHVLISYDGSKQYIFFNGKLVASNTATFTEYNESPIYIGGSNVYHSGMFGVIDDIQVWHKALTTEAAVKEAMQGYYGKTKPDGLAGYWSLENYTTTTDASGKKQYIFPNEVEGNDWNAEFISFNGAGGEDTSSATYVNEQPTPSAGCPTLPGTMNIVTTAELTSKGMGATTSGTTGGTLTGVSDGKYDVTLTLKNAWGSTVLTKPQYITVSGFATGIESIKDSKGSNGSNGSNSLNGKYILNDRMVIVKDGQKYNTAGQQLK